MKEQGRPAVEPLYTYNDAVDSLKFVRPVFIRPAYRAE